MLVNLAQGFAMMGTNLDFVVKNAGSSYLESLPPEVKLVELDSYQRNDQKKATIQYLMEKKPSAILSSKEENNLLAVRSRIKSGSSTKIVLRASTNISAQYRSKHRNPLKHWITTKRMKEAYSAADSIVAVSQGVAEDVNRITGIPLRKIHVINNPVAGPSLYDKASAPVHHPWFNETGVPVISGIGRLGNAKDFETLIRAFSKVRAKLDCRLFILGEGRQHSRLKQLSVDLGLENDIELPGFVANPYCFLARSSLFVLSSRWEGSPNTLTEALALGVPVVSTDCDSGPREILQDGRYGPLVPVGNPDLLAEAIFRTLAEPPDSEKLKEAVEGYTYLNSAEHYLGILKGIETG